MRWRDVMFDCAALGCGDFAAINHGLAIHKLLHRNSRRRSVLVGTGAAGNFFDNAVGVASVRADIGADKRSVPDLGVLVDVLQNRSLYFVKKCRQNHAVVVGGLQRDVAVTVFVQAFVKPPIRLGKIRDRFKQQVGIIRFPQRP